MKQELIETFRIFDKNETGKVNGEAFKAILTDEGIPQEDVDEFMAEMKLTKTGDIDYAAFAKRVAEGEVEKKPEVKRFGSKKK